MLKCTFLATLCYVVCEMPKAVWRVKSLQSNKTMVDVMMILEKSWVQVEFIVDCSYEQTFVPISDLVAHV